MPADYTVRWFVRDDPLPVISPELAEYILSSGEYDEFSCPNSFFSRKGREPAKAVLVMNYSKVQEWFFSDSTSSDNREITLGDLKIEYKQVDSASGLEVEDQEIVITQLYFHRVKEVLTNEFNIGDDSLCIVEMVDSRMGYNEIGSQHTESDLQSGVLDLYTPNVPEYLFNLSGEGGRWGGAIRDLDTTNQFLPEAGNGEQFYSKVSGTNRFFFYEALDRTENIFFQDKDGTPVAQKLSYFDAATQEKLTDHISEADDTETLSEEDRNALHTVFPDGIDVWFWKDTSKAELIKDEQTANYSRNLNLSKVWGVYAGRQPVYPITSPLLPEGSTNTIQNVRVAVADAYKAEYEAQAQIDPKQYIFNGNIDFNWRSHITEIGYTNNPFGVKTYVSVEPRHGRKWWEFPQDRTLSVTSPEVASIGLSFPSLSEDTETRIPIAINRVTNATGALELDGSYPTSDIFKGFAFTRLTLHQAGTYIYNIPFQIAWAGTVDSGTTATMDNSTGGATMSFQPVPDEEISMFVHLVSPRGTNDFDPGAPFMKSQIEERTYIKKTHVVVTADSVNGTSPWSRNLDRTEELLSGIFTLDEVDVAANPVEFQVWAKTNNTDTILTGPDVTASGANPVGETDRRAYILYIPNKLNFVDSIGNAITPPMF